jgi:hypothetical protein
MDLRTIEILLTKTENLSKPLIRDRVGLALQDLLKSLGFTPDIEIGIELCNEFFIPIIIQCHD